MQANNNAGNRNRKRPSWDEYFIEIAKVVSTRATCLRRNYGAVIVRDNIIISTGYNGSPRGEVNCIDAGKCLREEMKVPKGERYELCAAVQPRTFHVEAAAEIQAEWLHNANSVGITAGASTPPDQIEAVAARIRQIAQQSDHDAPRKPGT